MVLWTRAKNEYQLLPPALVRYILLVTASGPALVVLFALTFAPELRTVDWPVAVILTAIALVSERFPLHLTHKTNINLATVAYIAMFLMLNPTWCVVLILAASTSAQYLRFRADSTSGIAEPLFNVGQTATYVTLAAAAAELTTTVFPSVRFADIDLGVCLVVATAMHLGNTALVAGAAGRHLGTSVLRVWFRNLSLDLGPQLAMTLMGVCAAAVGNQSPVLIPALVLPAILIHRAVGQSVQLRENVYQALASMVEIVELRDPYTAGHSRRVAQTARLLAINLGLTDEEADVIHIAGTVHDIGKVAINPNILGKAGKLNDEEWAEMTLHPVFGAEVVAQFESYRGGVALVRGHHEAWDGSGYPDALAGETIPFGARILAVADTFDAMTSDRPYRDGMSVERARVILQDGADKQWDGRVVCSLMALLDETPCPIPVCQRSVSVTTISPSSGTEATTVAA